MNRKIRQVLSLLLASVVGIVSGSSYLPSFSNAVETSQCQGADIDIELCIVAGVREGTFVLRDRDGTIVASIPSDPTSCPDQTFEVALNYPTAKPDQSVPREQRLAPMLSVRASTSTCPKAASSRVLRLERSEVRYGLGKQDLAEMTFAPSIESISALRNIVLGKSVDIELKFVRPQVAVDSLTTSSRTVTGKPCAKARRRAKCMAAYARALANPTPYGVANCGRCPVSPARLFLIYTRRDVVVTVTDLRGFLGPIDTAADAALLLNSTAVATDGNAWLVVRGEIDGTCDPFERSEIYERVQRDGTVDLVARLLVSRAFGTCA